jgi:hypothetical protein
VAEQVHLVRVDQRALTVEEARRAVVGHQRQVHVRRLAGGGGPSVVEVDVPVEEPQFEAGRQPQEDPGQDRAVTAQDERVPAVGGQLQHPRGDVPDGLADLVRADHPGLRVPDRVGDERVERPGVLRSEPRDESRGPQRHRCPPLAPPPAGRLQRGVQHRPSHAVEGSPP